LTATLLILSGDIESNPGPPTTTVHSVNFAFVNTHSVVQKTAIVHSLINELKLDCLALTETWIKQSHPDAIKLDPAPPGYVVFHTHRPDDKTGGGVAFIARDDLRARQFSLSDSYPSCDILSIQLPTTSGRLNIITLYQPTTRSAVFYAELQDLLDEVSNLPGHSVICGDFNSPSSISHGSLDQRIIDLLAMNEHQQHVSQSTHRYGGLLDLLITPIGSSIIKSAPTVKDLGVSDHLFKPFCRSAGLVLLLLSFNVGTIKGSLRIFSAVNY